MDLGSKAMSTSVSVSLRSCVKTAFAGVTILWMVAAIGGLAAAQGQSLGNVGDPLGLGDDFSTDKDTYLGGLNDLSRHNPSLSESEAPLSLRDLDKDEPAPLVIPTGRVVAAPAASSSSPENTTRSNNAGNANGPRETLRNITISGDLAARIFGADGLINDTDQLLAFRTPSVAETGPAKPSTNTLREYGTKRESIYELGLISPSVPTFGGNQISPSAESFASLKIADLGIKNPAFHIRMTIPNFGGNYGSSGQFIGNSKTGFSVSSQSGESRRGQAPGDRSLGAWVRRSISQAVSQPLFYVVMFGALMIAGFVAVRRSS